MNAINKISADPYDVITEILRGYGISICAGVTGGGIIHFTKKMEPYRKLRNRETLSFFNVGEYAAAFLPLGYYLATGTVAAATATTGAATKLLGCGITDAKLHNIPALYIVPLSPRSTAGFAPLQDSTAHGMNTLAQLEAELPGGVFVLDEFDTMVPQIERALAKLAQGRPAVLVLDPSSLARIPSEARWTVPASRSFPRPEIDIPWPLDQLSGRKVVMLVGSAMPTTATSRKLVTELATTLGAAVVYSINGANAVERENPYLYGYLGFGGNGAAGAVWSALDEQTVLIGLGADFDEYTTGLSPISCGEAWLLNNDDSHYGVVEGSCRHLIDGACFEVNGPLEAMLSKLTLAISRHPPATRRFSPAPADLNTRPIEAARPGFVDMATFYRRIDTLWRKNSIGFDDVCMSYKDRQYITQRPNPDCPFFSLYRGSAMGGAFGLGVGARLGAPDKSVFIFSGDGCFRLFAGYLAETKNLRLNLFVLNNRMYGIVRNGLTKILKHDPVERYHDGLEGLNYEAIATGFGWDYAQVRPDLTNLDDIMTRCYQPDTPSLLIELPLDPEQDLGPNPRLENL